MDLGIGSGDKEAQEFWLSEGAVYGHGSPHSFFRDFIATGLANQERSRQADAMGSPPTGRGSDGG
jgi:hypothetical protein